MLKRKPKNLINLKPMVQKFKKRPVVIEAIRFCAYTEGLPPALYNNYTESELWHWMHSNGANFRVTQIDPGPAYMEIKTLEGTMRANIGDWIIKGVKGEFYPCRDDIFQATYEIFHLYD